MGLRALPLAPLILALTGCFSYVPAEVGEASVDDRVRARVETTTGERIAAATGAPYTETVIGRVTAVRPDSVVLSVAVRLPAGRPPGPSLAQSITVPSDAIRSLEVRVLDRPRTVAVSVGAAALMGYILYQAFVRTDPSGSNGEDNPPVDESKWPAGDWR